MVRYPFLFTSSSYSLQAYCFQQFTCILISKSPFLSITWITPTPMTYTLEFLVRYSFRCHLHIPSRYNFFQQFSWIGYCNRNQKLYFPHECQQRPRIYMCKYWCLPRLDQLWLGHHPIILRMFCCCFCCSWCVQKS